MEKTHPSLGDPGDEVVYYPRALPPTSKLKGAVSDPIPVRVPFADIPTIFAHRQWRAGMLMADLICTNALQLEGANVLELGAGTGLPSIAAHRYGGARHVVVTDYDSPCLVSTLRANVKANVGLTPSVTVLGHTWAKAIDDVRDTIASGSFDVILLADCIWDHLSHASLLKSITSLLRKDGSSRVYMVSGLHTGRDNIVSFIRRSHRQGLRLALFSPLSSLQWPPQLSPSEAQIQAQEGVTYANEDALALAPELVIEMQLLTDKSEEATQDEAQRANGTRTWQAKTARLSDIRRTFVIEEREEEKREKESVHVRNRWITFLALAWQ